MESVVTDIVARCRDRAAEGGAPVVVLDLDLTAWWPYQRVRAALRHLECVERLRGLVELAGDGLPGLYSGAWREFVSFHALAGRRRDVLDLELEYRSALSWTPARLRRDMVADGLVGFAGAVAAAGGRLVALTGRPQWLEPSSVKQLRAAGLMGVDVVTAPRRCGRATPEGKVAARLPGVDEADVVAAIDDCRANREALRRRWPGALVAAMSAPGFLSDAAPSEPQMNSFRLTTLPARDAGVVAADVLASTTSAGRQ